MLVWQLLLLGWSLKWVVSCPDGLPENFTYKVKSSYGLETQIMEAKTITTEESDTGIILASGNLTNLCNGMFNLTLPVNTIFTTSPLLTQIEVEFLIKQTTINLKLVFFECNINTIKTHNFKDIGIKSLRFDQCAVQVLENEAFYNLSNLQTLELPSNKLSNWNPSALVQLKQLWSISLNDNQIQSLGRSAFVVLGPHEAAIDFLENKIGQLDEDVFLGMRAHNVTIGLDHNLITSLPANVFKGHSFNLVQLMGNPLKKLSYEFMQSCVQIRELEITCSTLSKRTLRYFRAWARKNSISTPCNIGTSLVFWPFLLIFVILSHIYACL